MPPKAPELTFHVPKTLPKPVKAWGVRIGGLMPYAYGSKTSAVKKNCLFHDPDGAVRKPVRVLLVPVKKHQPPINSYLTRNAWAWVSDGEIWNTIVCSEPEKILLCYAMAGLYSPGHMTSYLFPPTLVPVEIRVIERKANKK